MMIRRSRSLCQPFRRSRPGIAAIALGILLFSLPPALCHAVENTETDVASDSTTALWVSDDKTDKKPADAPKLAAPGLPDSKPAVSTLKFRDRSEPRPVVGNDLVAKQSVAPRSKPVASDISETNAIKPPQQVAFRRTSLAPVTSIFRFRDAMPPVPQVASIPSRPSEPNKLANSQTWQSFNPTSRIGFVRRADGASVPVVERLPDPSSEMPPARLVSHTEPSHLPEAPNRSSIVFGRPLADANPAFRLIADASQEELPPPDGGETLGTAPEEDFSLQFLRRQAVLMESGQWQFDFGISYSQFDAEVPDSVVAGREIRIRQRFLIMPLTARYGWNERLQFFTTLPFGWTNSELSSPGISEDFQNDGGVGDFRGGFTTVVKEGAGCANDPDILATFAFTAPTGNSTYLESLLGDPTTNLGGGFWALSWNMLFIHSYDPVVVFYGVGSRHRFARTLGGIYVNPGDQYLYNFGVGFAVNESVTLSAIFLGQYITEPELNGARIPGLAREPMRLRFAATMRNACRFNLVEPFVEVGMTDDAPDANLGITWTY